MIRDHHELADTPVHPPHTPVRLCVLCDAFGAPSMTFVYRQLVGLGPRFRAWVLTRGRRNAELYPFEPVVEMDRTAYPLQARAERQLRRIRLKTRYSSLAPYIASSLQTHPTDLIHAHYGPLGLAALGAARRGGIPLVVTFHGFDASELVRDPVYVEALQPLFRYARIICVSNAMRRTLLALGADPDRTLTHYIGVPVEDIPFIERRPVTEKVRAGEDVVLLQVSRFVEKKGHRVTLEAFAHLARDTGNVRLVLAGEGPLREECMSLATDLGVSDRVSFPGEVAGQETLRLMAEADVFLHHSITPPNGDQEGIPTVIMEAMASGLPVVSTIHSGIPELVVDGESGYLVAEGDVTGYADRLRRVMGDDGRLGRRGRQRVLEDFDLTRQNALLETIYEDALRPGRTGDPSHR